MGRRIMELAVAQGHDVCGFDVAENDGAVLTPGQESGKPRSITVSADAAAEIAKADVMIDFTHASVCLDNARKAVAQGKPVVIGTTGLTESQQAELKTLGEQVPIVFAPNMSVGVNLLFKLTREVAEILGLSYNVEIVEAHHNQKKDSPSGTAVRLAERAAEGLNLNYDKHVVHGRHGMVGARPIEQIGMHAVRGGDIVGEHTVSFIGQGERVELTHKAHNRDNFAAGSIKAAEFVQNATPGLYDMQDVLGLT